ncbi:MAG TPA: hypothetical protein VJ180_14815 [Pyrinomonadaceae bacterium]|nr:hypothetical protein [Pyrinomonadaceae bacterium]
MRRNVGGGVHVQEDGGVAEELLDAEVEHHACRLLDAARESGKIVEICGPDPGAAPGAPEPMRVSALPRRARIALGEIVYQALNRANGRN